MERHTDGRAKSMNLLEGIDAVTFDVGGTLIEPWPSVGHVYAQVAARHGMENISAETLNQQFAAAWKTKKNFGYSLSDWSNLVDQTFAGLITTPPSETFFPALYEHFGSPDTWQVFDDVVPCLERLQGRGIRLAAISNWDERLRPLLHNLKLDRYFEFVLVSAEVDCGKPCQEIFQRAAEQLGIAPESILHIGDSAVEDFEGAKAAGFKSLLLRREEKPIAESQIGSLAELTAN